MELNLEIAACRGERPDPPVQLKLHTGSCTLGRTPDNDLVLPDAERMVSGRHARVDVSDTEVLLTDLSTNGTYVNDAVERLPRDQSTRLSHGDRLLIGPYEIAVSIRLEDPDADDIFGFDKPAAPDPGLGAPLSDVPRGPLSDLMPGMERHGPAADILDLLADSGDAPSSPGVLDAADEAFADARPLDELLSGPTDAQSAPESAESRPTPVDQVFFHPPEMAAIPDGYDLLRDAEPPKSPPAAPPIAPELPEFSPVPPTDSPRKPSPGRAKAASAEPPAFDPFGPDVDLPTFEPVGDVGPGAGLLTGDEHRSAPGLGVDNGLPADGPGSEDLPQPSAARHDAKSARVTAPSRQPSPSPASPLRPDAGDVDSSAAAPIPTPSARAAASRPASGDALSAFLAGLGAGDPAQIDDQDEFLRLAGALLRVLVSGLSATLMTRAQFKSELRLGVTTIRAVENNPFKFSVNPEDALDRLLFRPNPSFMPPLEAAQQGFDDIQAHEMAMIAGLRSALRALLARFDPATLEAKLADSGLDKVLPMVRKSRCWEQFTETYGQVSADATEDFTELFGEAFTRAYDDQILRLERARRGAR